MHELEKLGEARYFLTRMRAMVNEREHFRYELSAFLSAARSALQYAHKEAMKRSGETWYQASMRASHYIAFFKDKRDVNVHTLPVNPSATFDATITNRVIVSDMPSVAVERPDGTIVQRADYGPAVDAKGAADPPAEGSVTVTYQFTDWVGVGSNDVIAMSQGYIVDLERMLNDGVARGFLPRARP